MINNAWMDSSLITDSILIENNTPITPTIIEKGIFAVTNVKQEWGFESITFTRHTLSVNTAIEATPKETTATVSPVIHTVYDTQYVTSGRAQAQIKYYKQSNNIVMYNAGGNTEANVITAYTEFAKRLSQEVDRSLLKGYSDTIYRAKGLTGLADYAKDIGNDPMSPTSYDDIYDFFVNSIEDITSDLQIKRSEVTLLISRDAVLAMGKGFTIGESVWDRIKRIVLSDVRIFEIDTLILSNQCFFVATNYASICISDSPFSTLKPEARTDGNDQYVRYVECLLPSMVVTNSNACLSQANLFSTAMRSRSKSIKNVTTQEKKTQKKNEMISIPETA